MTEETKATWPWLLDAEEKRLWDRRDMTDCWNIADLAMDRRDVRDYLNSLEATVKALREALLEQLPGCWHLDVGAGNYCRAQPPKWELPPELYGDNDWRQYFCDKHKPDNRRIRPYQGDKTAWAALALTGSGSNEVKGE